MAVTSKFFSILRNNIRVAQWKRAGPITQIMTFNRCFHNIQSLNKTTMYFNKPIVCMDTGPKSQFNSEVSDFIMRHWQLAVYCELEGSLDNDGRMTVNRDSRKFCLHVYNSVIFEWLPAY